ncbi:TetR/AcrR family transcriptional regulator [Pleurocapsa sp. PCC 7319]|uniref:TetR/AcrR family transcriptional regulator n=1 Tax=Pleurocapsa sp. PCC 7319 TaxID=118161 RepID=UPI0003692F2A|nr:TetR family transcriptional regulator [Pleurocapsa sp. PCC 7319]
MSECQDMKENTTNENPKDSKADRILEAAKSCFLNYGFKKTSMSDIAKQAKMSRPALYLHFDNKETIFCALVEQLQQQTLSQAEIVLQPEGKIGDRLKQAFECHSVELFSLVANSTHGNELIDINGKVAAEINRASVDKFIQLLAQALEESEVNQEIRLKNLDLTSLQAAELLVNSSHGLKQAATSVEDYRVKLKQIIRVFEKAIAI